MRILKSYHTRLESLDSLASAATKKCIHLYSVANLFSSESYMDTASYTTAVARAPRQCDDELPKLKEENAQLRIRCEELTAQSQLNQDILHHCTYDLSTKDAELQDLQKTVSQLQTKCISTAGKDAEIMILRSTVEQLQTALEDQQANHIRLQAMCYPPTKSTHENELLDQVEKLSSENAMLHDKLDRRAADTKTRIAEYADELNELSDQLRLAEESTRSYSHKFMMSENICKVLQAERDHTVALLNSQSTANKDLRSRDFRRSQHTGSEVQALRLQNDVLTTQFAQAQSSAIEDWKLIATFKEQHKQLMTTIEQERKDRTTQVDKVHDMYAENTKDRKKFEQKLKAKDRHIQELKSTLKSPQSPASLRISANSSAISPPSHIDRIRLQELEDKLAPAELIFKEEFAELVRNIQFEADDSAKRNQKLLEDEIEYLTKELLKERAARDGRKADSGVGF
jgi:predicted RNase H-like nuclease (RuvC/YqgF family)